MTELRVVPNPPIDPVGTDRRERVYEVIGDYIGDKNVSPEEAYGELLSEVEGWIKYHSDCLEKASDLYNLLLNQEQSKVSLSD
tara:strand:- start:3462 stop:3710 length:249 start_codon:yes stop_codon:yes gene_type:complete